MQMWVCVRVLGVVCVWNSYLLATSEKHHTHTCVTVEDARRRVPAGVRVRHRACQQARHDR
eukprot:147175-Prymnesium_polylepis.1